ncbi:Aldo/keto reductase family protein [Kandleria vitulina]|uniref:Aldo/keto reductase family protein n=1 Tax=Kandleria vitulina TaxID=1630 RepID=A0A1H2UVE2_9FIRM|nr:aldo/keto reductase [Kandleria vitulina]SDW60100.1 Aldo/keto reductase family protein [Kandleria vitulina]
MKYFELSHTDLNVSQIALGCMRISEMQLEEVAQALNQLIDEGKVRYIGVSNHTPGEIELLQSYLADPLIINQLQLSIVHSYLIDSSMTLNMSTPYSIERSFRKKKSNEISREIFIAFSFAYNLQ